MTGDGTSVPLGEVADVSVRKLPEMIRNDNGTLAGFIYVDISGVTATDYVDRAQQALATQVKLPPGYSVEWTGLYEYTTAASARLRVIIPITLGIIFLLLVIAFHSVSEAFLVAMSVPFAMAGGVFLQWALGYAMTTAVIIGYISVFAVAVQTGIIMVIFIREALDHRPADQPFLDAVVEGSTARLRPKLMTVATIVLSLSLIPLSSGPGMEIMKPIAAPSIGGMVTSTLHVLFMTPCLFVITEDVKRYLARRRRGKAAVEAGALRGRRNGYAMTPRAAGLDRGRIAPRRRQLPARAGAARASPRPRPPRRRRPTRRPTRSTCARWTRTSARTRPASARAAAWRSSPASRSRRSITSTSPRRPRRRLDRRCA